MPRRGKTRERDADWTTSRPDPCHSRVRVIVSATRIATTRFDRSDLSFRFPLNGTYTSKVRSISAPRRPLHVQKPRESRVPSANLRSSAASRSPKKEERVRWCEAPRVQRATTWKKPRQEEKERRRREEENPKRQKTGAFQGKWTMAMVGIARERQFKFVSLLEKSER